MPTEEECRQASQFRDDFWLNVIYVFQLIFSLFSAASILGILWNMKWSKMPSIFNANLKALLLVGAFLILLNATITFSFYLYLLVINHLHWSACDYVWPIIKCIAIRSLQHYSTICFTTLHLIVLLERMYAIRKVDDRLDFVGKCLISLVFIIPIFLIYYMYVSEFVPGLFRSYCVAASPSSSNAILRVTWFMAVVDVCTSVGDVWLRNYCKKQLTKEKRLQMTLNDSFRMRELQMSIRVVLPLALFHTIIFLPWPVLISIGRPSPGLQVVHFIEAAILFKAFYCGTLPLSYYYFQRRQPRRINDEWLWSINMQAKIHFDQLRRQLRYT